MINIKIERFHQFFAENMIAELKDVVGQNYTLHDDRRRDLYDFLDGLMWHIQNPVCPACGAKGQEHCKPVSNKGPHIPTKQRMLGARRALHFLEENNDGDFKVQDNRSVPRLEGTSIREIQAHQRRIDQAILRGANGRIRAAKAQRAPGTE